MEEMQYGAIKEAIELFLKECREMGTLNEVPEEAGFLIDEKVLKEGNRPIIEKNQLQIISKSDNICS